LRTRNGQLLAAARVELLSSLVAAIEIEAGELLF